MFGPLSRYQAIETATWPAPDGTSILYVRRRFLPASSDGSSPPPLAEHHVTRGDRLDIVTARYLADPTQFWRVADANEAMEPEELTAEIGGVITIPLPGAR